MFLRLFACALVACSSSPKTKTTTADDAPERFEDLAVLVSTHLHRFSPASAVELGLHDHDGKLPDHSPAGLDTAVAQLEKDRKALTGAEVTTSLERMERDVLLQVVREELFKRVDQDAYRTNPIAYTWSINLDAYIIRDYAPIARRAQAVIDLCRDLPAYLQQARTNLKLPMPRTWIDIALLRTKGFAEFADKDMRQELAGQANIAAALDACKQTLTEHAAWLEKQAPSGTAGYALGKERFLKMLAETQGVDIDLARLTAIAEEDLRRNIKAIEEAAQTIAQDRKPRDVVLEQADIKPEPNEILDTATQQTEAMRQFVQTNRIVTIPSGDVAIVRESPPFQRYNAASLNAPGPFEEAPLAAYYYISPPDPKWPPAEQRAFIIPTNDLLFTTIHEVWPGHFLQNLHAMKNPSKVLKAFSTYTNVEGWAHYTEEMMFDAGAGGRTAQARIGMLKEALLRNARFVSAIGLHTGGMTVEQAAKLFEDKGFVDPANARQQAVRGTFDPMYISYTLGKLMIRKLRDDWMKKQQGATLLEFHDTFLSYGAAPIPLIRRAMLDDDNNAL
ncbi:MAG: DUF885 domain-containing protein [Deltaproteobacteria bacterium]|nr:DUF885 domain-containing protein [Deltaproteobacteria bacterium]